MIFELIAGLHDSSSRLSAAKRLAEFLGASDLIIFIRDSELNLLLPGPGYLQTLQNGPAWQKFVSACGEEYHRGRVPYPDRNTYSNAIGFADPEGSVAVLIGGSPQDNNIEPLRKLLPLITALLKKEQQVISNVSIATTAENTARKAQKLAQSLDFIRQDLRKALVKQDIDRQAIEELMNKKDEFMNIASHELKTPLTSMKSYNQMIQRRLHSIQPDKLLLDFSDKANKQTEKLIALVNDLFDLSKIQSGRMVFNVSKFDFNELITDCIEQIQNTTHTHQIVLNGEIANDFSGDRNRLEQVFSNLLSNAVKYSPKANKVLVEVKSNDDMVEVKITDYGIGISQQDLPNISQRFFRVQSIANKFNGLGLGLYISSQIIKGHSGQLVVESNLGTGSAFRIILPTLRS